FSRDWSSDVCSSDLDLAKDLAMRAAYLFPAADIGDEHPHADHVAERGAGLCQRRFNLAEDVNGLSVRVADAVNRAGLVTGGSTKIGRASCRERGSAD